MSEERMGKIDELLSLLEDEQVEQAVLRAVCQALGKGNAFSKTTPPQLCPGQSEFRTAREPLAEERQKRQQTEADLKREQEEHQKTKEALAQAQQKLQQIEPALNRTRADLEQAQNRCVAAEAALGKKRAELEKTQEVLKEKETDLERLLSFREAVEAFNRYRVLASELPEYLAQSLPLDDALHFLAVGCQRDTIERLWDRFRERAEQLTAEQLETVEFLLAFFLSRYNSLYDRPVYQLMLEEAGRPFDDQRHSRSPACSKYQGEIERVIFPGIWNLRQNKALRKSVVYFQRAY